MQQSALQRLAAARRQAWESRAAFSVIVLFLTFGIQGVLELSQPNEAGLARGMQTVMHPQITELLKQAGWYLCPLLLATAVDWQEGDASFASAALSS
jgi:hypothetical protein